MQLQKEAHEKEETHERMIRAEKRVHVLEDENKQLKRDVSDMKKELDKLRKEVRGLCFHCLPASWRPEPCICCLCCHTLV